MKILCAATGKNANGAAVSSVPCRRSPFLLGNVSGVKTLKPPSRSGKIEWEDSRARTRLDLQFVARLVASAQVRKKDALLDKYHAVNVREATTTWTLKAFSAARTSVAGE